VEVRPALTILVTMAGRAQQLNNPMKTSNGAGPRGSAPAFSTGTGDNFRSNFLDNVATH